MGRVRRRARHARAASTRTPPVPQHAWPAPEVAFNPRLGRWHARIARLADTNSPRGRRHVRRAAPGQSVSLVHRSARHARREHSHPRTRPRASPAPKASTADPERRRARCARAVFIPICPAPPRARHARRASIWTPQVALPANPAFREGIPHLPAKRTARNARGGTSRLPREQWAAEPARLPRLRMERVSKTAARATRSTISARRKVARSARKGLTVLPRRWSRSDS